MKKMGPLFYIAVMTPLWILLLLGTVYGASVTLQREGALQNGQESAVSKPDVPMGGTQLQLAPQRLRGKSDPGMRSEIGNPSVKMERYKPYKEGEGERKIR